MTASRPVYGLDIETDTSVDGLDPRVARILAAAVSTSDGVIVFSGPEPDLLRDLDDHLRSLPPAVLATWNGAAFDLPFLADRSALHGITIGLRLVADPTLLRRHEPLPGHPCPYRARWYEHTHLDAYRLYRSDVGRLFGLSCSLKSIAAFVGLPTVEVDASRVHELTGPELHGYVASDAALARLLTERRSAPAGL